MKQAVRAIVTNGDKMLVMKRNKFGNEYYTLVGGGIEIGEDTETALRRELQEEAGLSVGRVQLLYVEEAGEPYGTQYVYWCEYQGGEPELSPDTIEHQITADGKNTYQPVWLPLNQLETTNFVSGSLKEALLAAFKDGYPSQPVQLEWKSNKPAGT